MTSKLVLSPHFDDAVFSTWDILVRERKNITNVTFCGGVPPEECVMTHWDGMCGFNSAREAAQKRAVEDANACEIAGVNWKHLDFLDLPYSKEKSIADIEEVLEKLVPDFDVVIAPIGIGQHQDHIVIRDAIISVYKKSRSFELVFYADCPYASVNGWDSDDSSKELDYQWSYALSQVEKQGVRLLEPTRIEFSETQVLEKLVAAKTYESQLKGLLEYYPALLETDGCFSVEVTWKCESVE